MFAVCECCKKEIHPTTRSSGFGTRDDHVLCYDCCADLDRLELLIENTAVLYLQHNNLTDQHELNRPEWEVTNWPGTLRFRATVRTTIKPHTLWHIRHDVWFVGPDGRHWYGRQQGDNDLVYCRKLIHQKEELHP